MENKQPQKYKARPKASSYHMTCQPDFQILSMRFGLRVRRMQQPWFQRAGTEQDPLKHAHACVCFGIASDWMHSWILAYANTGLSVQIAARSPRNQSWLWRPVFTLLLLPPPPYPDRDTQNILWAAAAPWRVTADFTASSSTSTAGPGDAT